MRRLVLIGVAIIVVAAAAYTAWWFRAADGLAAGVGTWQAARRAEGWDVALGKVSVGGYPFRLEAVADGFSIGRASPVPWRWTGPRLTASAPPWGGRELALEAPGAHRIEATMPHGPVTLALDAATAHGTVQVGPHGRIARLDAVLAGVDGRTGDGANFHADTVVLALTGAPPGQPAATANGVHAPEAGRLHLVADGIAIDGATTGALGRKIDHFEADIVLDGRLPDGPTRAALDAWRVDGGTVELRKVRIDWGEFQGEADGTLALDSDMQPIGAFTTRLWGVDQALDALVAGGQIDVRAGAMARIVLRMLATPSTRPGVPPRVEVPLTLQDRKVYLGPAKLASVPRIDWPAPRGER